jgi:hypothetical protein
VAELQKQAGATGETVKNFLSTLAENNRLGLLPGVCNKFGELMSAARGEVEMVVTSAQVRLFFPPAGLDLYLNEFRRSGVNAVLIGGSHDSLSTTRL